MRHQAENVGGAIGILAVAHQFDRLVEQLLNTIQAICGRTVRMVDMAGKVFYQRVRVGRAFEKMTLFAGKLTPESLRHQPYRIRCDFTMRMIRPGMRRHICRANQ